MSLKTSQIVSSALAAALSMGLVAQAAAHDAPEKKSKEKCYGIAKAGANDCSNLSGSHSCAGMSTKDKDIEEWQYVPKGECKAKGGLSHAEAKAKMPASAPKK